MLDEAIAQDDRPIERQARFRTIAVNEFVNAFWPKVLGEMARNIPLGAS